MSDGFTVSNIIKSFIGFEGETGAFPIVYQMWFVRDLIICVILSPFIYLCVRNIRGAWIILLLFAWVIGFEIPKINHYGLSMASIFFFSLGAYLSIYKINVIKLIHTIKIAGYIYPLLIIIELLTIGYQINHIIHNITILSGIILVFLCTDALLEKNMIKAIPFLSSASFFVFAIHDPILKTKIASAVTSLLPSSPAGILVSYFMTVLLTISIALLIYWLFMKASPRLLRVFSGGR